MNKSFVLSVLCLLCFSSLVSALLPPWANVSNVAYHRQDQSYSCGAAAFQTIFQAAGRYISNQSQIVDVIRASPLGGTLANDLSRGTYFSTISSAQGTVYPGKDTAGWINPQDNAPGAENVAAPGLGMVSYEFQPSTCDLTPIRTILAGGRPITAMVYFVYNSTDVPGVDYYFGHFRTLYSYNDFTQKLLAVDPWGRDNVPHVYTYTYSTFCGSLGWNYYEYPNPVGPYWAMVISNWQLQVSSALQAVSIFPPTVTFSITASLTFPCPAPLCTSWDNYAAVKTFSSVSLTIQLPSGVTLVTSNPSYTTSLTANVGTHHSNDAAVVVKWLVTLSDASLLSSPTINVVAQGSTSGTQGSFTGFPDEIYPAYSWTDNVGTQGSVTLP